MNNNEYEIVYLAQEGNEDAINYLYKKYKPIIVKKSENAIHMATHHGIDINDIIQECYMALDEAIKNFQQDGSATFSTFATLCIDRKIANFLRKTTGVRGKVLNDAITIDDNMEKAINNNIKFSEDFNKSAHKDMIESIKNELTDFEKEVFVLRIRGFSNEEVAKKLGKDLKSIYNTIQRIKYKMKKINEKDS